MFIAWRLGCSKKGRKQLTEQGEEGFRDPLRGILKKYIHLGNVFILSRLIQPKSDNGRLQHAFSFEFDIMQNWH